MIRSTKPHPMAEDARREEWLPVLVSVHTFTRAAVVVLPEKPGTCGLVSLPAKLTYLQRLEVDHIGEASMGKMMMVSDMEADQRADSMHCTAIAWLPRWLVIDRVLVPMGPVVPA